MPDAGSNNSVRPSNSPVPSGTTIDGQEIELPAHLLSQIRIGVPGYELLSEIGRGGQAVVYKATRTSTGELVAIKILHHGPFAGESARQRLQREIVALESLRHPNIVNILDSGQSPEGHAYLVMEYIAGQTLDDFIKGDRPGPPGDSKFMLTIFRKICSAMAAAHQRDITHRDLSPSNIIVDQEFEPHILDFGLARTTFDDLLSKGRPEISATGQFMGKFAYASPEQVRASRGAVDSRSDVYALGVILYRIVTRGRFPYKTEGDLDEVLKEILHTRPTPPSVVYRAIRMRDRRISRQAPNPLPLEVGPALEAIVMRALEKESEKRYQSAGEMEQDITSYLAGEPTLAQPRHGWRTWKWPAPGSAVLAGIGLIVVVAAVAIELRKHSRLGAAVTPIPGGEMSRSVAPPVDTAPIPRLTFGTPEIHGGNWTVEGEDLVQTKLIDPNATIVFGDPAWTNYNLTFKVNCISTSDSNGFEALFHWKEPGNFCALALGNASNSGFDLRCCTGGHWQHDPRMSRNGKIEFGRVYEVHIEVRGPEFRCFLDGEELFHKHDDGFVKGRIGLATSQAAARFREIRVSSVDGKILWNGPPASAEMLANVQAVKAR